VYGDTAVIRRRAAELRERAEEIRSEADALVARTDGVGWLGQAGDALRDRVRQRSSGLRRAAALHDDAADALERHAREVERLQRLIEEVERRVRRLVDAARSRLSGLAGALEAGLHALGSDDADRWWAGFDPPPHGSRRWLEVEVPGL
jgi:uncharacterized protein YukE